MKSSTLILASLILVGCGQSEWTPAGGASAKASSASSGCITLDTKKLCNAVGYEWFDHKDQFDVAHCERAIFCPEELPPGGRVAESWRENWEQSNRVEVNSRIAALVNEKYKHGTAFMGWAHPEDHCYVRTRAFYYFSNFGQLPQYDETDEPAQRAMMDAIRADPQSPVAEIRFLVAGTVELKGEFAWESPEGKPRLEYEAVWTNHSAAAINSVDGEVLIVDMAASREAMTLEQWEGTFLPDELKGSCAMNDDDAKAAIMNYNIMKSLRQNPPIPETKCVYEILPIFRDRDGVVFDDNQLIPHMWDDVHKMVGSTDNVRMRGNMYFWSHPEQLPLPMLSTLTSIHKP